MANDSAERGRTHRSIGGWTWCLLLAAVAVALPTLAVNDAIKGPEMLRHRGVKATASVIDSGSKTCEVMFVVRSDGPPRLETERLDAYFHVGEKIPVVYDPRHPSTVRVADSIGAVREYVTHVPIVALGLAAAFGAIAVFRRTSPKRRA